MPKTVKWSTTSPTSDVSGVPEGVPGVYIIFNSQKVLHIGKSANNVPEAIIEAVRRRLEPHHISSFYTWAKVDKADIGRVKRFLIEHYNPLYDQAVSVNLPELTF